MQSVSLLVENLAFNPYEKVEAKMSLFITFCCFNGDTEGLGYIQVEKIAIHQNVGCVAY